MLISTMAKDNQQSATGSYSDQLASKNEKYYSFDCETFTKDKSIGLYDFDQITNLLTIEKYSVLQISGL